MGRMMGAWLAGLAIVIGVAGCGSAPRVGDHKVFEVAGAAKVRRVLFFYQEAALEQKTTYRSGRTDVGASPYETGLATFGASLVQRSAAAFGRHGMAVEHASVVPVGEWRYRAGVVFGQFGDERLRGATVITVKPMGGYSSANLHSANISMRFEVRVIDAGTKRVIWAGAIDTSTWKGRDFILRNVEGRSLDDAYAEEFIAAVVQALRKADQA